MATKFAPLPWRLNAESVPLALKASLDRMQLPKTQLYMQHWWVPAHGAYLQASGPYAVLC